MKTENEKREFTGHAAVDCHFFDSGFCLHKDAPPPYHCIGMGNDITGGCTAWEDGIDQRIK